MQDPWGTPTEEPQPVPAAEPQQPELGSNSTVVGSVDVAVRPVIQPAVEAGKLTLTFKGAGTFADRWLVAHVANPAEGLDLLNDPKFKELLDLSKKISVYDGGGTAPVQAASAPQRQLQPGQPAGSVEAPSWAPDKPEADFVYKTGVAKASGKTWHAWMPPTKEDPRQPKFFYPPNSR